MRTGEYYKKLIWVVIISGIILPHVTFAITPSFLSGGWLYRKPITITNSAASTLTNYQERVVVTYTAAMKANFDDIQFSDSDGTTALSYWLESKTNSTTATFWVKVPSVPASSTATIYLYYGNSADAAISASSVDDTFIYGDDFNGNNLSESRGIFTSRVLNAGASTSWTNLAWTPDFPSSKELPNSAGVETAYPAGNADMTNNVLLLHLNETGSPTSFTDNSGQANTGTCSGAACPTPTTSGEFNGAQTFDGANTYVNAGSAANLDDISVKTIEAWIYPTGWGEGSAGRIMSKSSTNANGFNFQVLSGQIQYLQAGNTATGDWTTPSSSVVLNRWQHIVLVYDKSSLDNNPTIYINGVSQTVTKNTAPSDSFTTDAAQNLIIGARYNGSTYDRYFAGTIDEVAVYSRALSATEALDHYQRGTTRLKFQVRSCDDASCYGESFMGSDGTQNTYYSGLATNAIALPSIALSGVPNNRYFQYRAWYATDDALYSAKLMSTTITAGNGVYGDSTSSNFNSGTLLNTSWVTDGVSETGTAPVWTEVTGANASVGTLASGQWTKACTGACDWASGTALTAGAYIPDPISAGGTWEAMTRLSGFTPNASRKFGMMLYSNSLAGYQWGSLNTAYDMNVAGSASSCTAGDGSSPVYLKIQKTTSAVPSSSNTFKFFESNDASSWTQCGTSAPSDTMPNLGMMLTSSITGSSTATYDWFAVKKYGTADNPTTNSTGSTQYAAADIPAITSPTAGEINTSRTLAVTASAYAGPAGSTHASSDWQISSNNTFSDSDCSGVNVVWCKMSDAAHLTNTTVTATNGAFQNALAGQIKLGQDTTYYVRVRYHNQTSGSNWSPSIMFVTDNARPTTSATSINSGASAVTLTENTTTTVTTTTTATDTDGCADITGVQVKLYRTSIGSAAADDTNNHYTITCAQDGGSCVGDIATYTCTAAVQYYADPTDTGSLNASDTWTAQAIASDAGGAGAADTDTIEMNTLTALNATTSLDFAALALGADTGATNQTMTITNTGNEGIDVGVSGYGSAPSDGKAMSCTTGSVPIANEKYHTAAFTYSSGGTTLTSNAATVNLNIPQRTDGSTTSSLYWGLGIPASGAGGACNGTIVVSPVSDPNLN